MVDRLAINRVVDCFYFLNIIESLWLFQKVSCVLSSALENQTVVTIGTLLHDLQVEF